MREVAIVMMLAVGQPRYGGDNGAVEAAIGVVTIVHKRIRW